MTKTPLKDHLDNFNEGLIGARLNEKIVEMLGETNKAIGELELHIRLLKLRIDTLERMSPEAQ